MVGIKWQIESPLTPHRAHISGNGQVIDHAERHTQLPLFVTHVHEEPARREVEMCFGVGCSALMTIHQTILV
jgi:hypothetical protein